MPKCNQDIWRENVTQSTGVHDTLLQKVHTHITNASSDIIGTNDELLKLADSARAKSVLSVNTVIYDAVYAPAIPRHTPAGIYLLKVNNRNTRTRCEICSKLTIKTPERRLASFWCLYC